MAVKAVSALCPHERCRSIASRRAIRSENWVGVRVHCCWSAANAQLDDGLGAGREREPHQYDKPGANPALIASFVPEVIRRQTPLAHKRAPQPKTPSGGKLIHKHS